MTRPYSNDLRERVVSAVLSGESCRVVAARFDVAVSSVVKWSQRFRATGSVAPGKIGGHRRRLLEPHREFILERIDQTPHLTRSEIHGVGRGARGGASAALDATIKEPACWAETVHEGGVTFHCGQVNHFRSHQRLPPGSLKDVGQTENNRPNCSTPATLCQGKSPD